MLRAIPTGWFSTNYDLLENENPIGRIEFAFASESASMTVRGEEYKIYRERWMSGLFLLESDRAGILASAEKPSALVRSFEVTFTGRTFTLEAESAFLRKFILREGENTPIGWIYPDHFLTNRSTIQLPDFFPTHIQAFMFWLTALLWKRDSDSAAAGGV